MRSPTQLCSIIDHTLLRPDATREEIIRLCEEALEWEFGAICIAPCWIDLCRPRLGPKQKLVTVVGFPLGSSMASTKIEETRCALDAGADEIDMVVNIGYLKSGEARAVTEEIRAVVDAAGGRCVKVILETGSIDVPTLTRGCQLAGEAGAHYVKTCTGFGPRGASLEDIRIMKQAVGDTMGIKAAGGIRDWAFAKTLLQAGATRLGTSASIEIVREFRDGPS